MVYGRGSTYVDHGLLPILSRVDSLSLLVVSMQLSPQNNAVTLSIYLLHQYAWSHPARSLWQVHVSYAVTSYVV